MSYSGTGCSVDLNSVSNFFAQTFNHQFEISVSNPPDYCDMWSYAFNDLVDFAKHLDTL